MTESKQESWFNDVDGHDVPASARVRGWIFYDADCRSCTASAKTFARVFHARQLQFVPLQAAWAQKQLRLQANAPLTEMRVLTADGQDFAGARAIIFLARQVWWMWPVFALAQFPGAEWIADRAYRWIADHRSCGGNLTCRVSSRDDVPVMLNNFRDETSSSLRSRITPWIGLVILPPLALLTRNHVAPWVFMWLMATAIFLGCKWLTLQRTKTPHSDFLLSLGYLLAWPGMDARPFTEPRRARRKIPRASELAFTTAKTAFGAFLLFGVARHLPSSFVAGWVGMIGFIFILHFGSFHLLAIAWQTFGVNAKPIMDAPWRAASLSEFWSRRWNRAFNELVTPALFRPLADSIGAIRATLMVFLISGLLHELVISLPAGAGYGMPTAYFVLQGWGIVTQRCIGKRSRLITFLLAGGPAVFLFHPPFVNHVIIPFMRTIGAL